MTGIVLHPQMGYPFALDVSVGYALDDRGLTVTSRATNVGTAPCPFASGQHPYLSSRPGLVDDCWVQLEAQRYMPTNDIGLPSGVVPVVGTPYGLRAERRVGAQKIDDTYTDLTRDADGLAWVRFTGSDGCRVGVWVWVDDAYPFLEVYTSHTQPEPHYRAGLGVEPMTCQPNGFRNGEHVIRLEPGQTAHAQWGSVLQR